MIIRKEIDLSKPLTSEQMKMLHDMESRPVHPDEDCPELTEEQFVRFARASTEREKRIETMQTVAIRLSPQAVNKAKSLGEGYTSILGRILESVLADNDAIRHYLQG